MSEEGVSTVKLVVNGADFDATFDYFTHAWTADGHKNTLFAKELEALQKLEKHLESVGKAGRTWQRLFTTVSVHAGAPAGYTFLVRSGGAGVAAEVQHRESDAVTNDSITYFCTGTNGKAFRNSWDTQWAEHDSLTGEGGSGRNATTGNEYHGKLWTNTPGGCRVGRATSSGGNGRGSCEGRCGAGCPRTYNFYFTYDCLDHDVCLDYHPKAPTTSSSGDCGYEYSDAYSDWMNGSSSSYSSSCGSVPSDCEDNGNSVGPGK
ncbi:MAG: hypothetical protein HYV09_31840 [Deltaproteobacteria bacterium]|nr:hypothetical protein [Deltaproteobacteria bacterium]